MTDQPITRADEDVDYEHYDEAAEAAAAPVAEDLSLYWGPVYDLLVDSRDKEKMITIGTTDGGRAKGTKGYVDQIAADWVHLSFDTGLFDPERGFWIARSHIVQIAYDTGR